MKKLTKRVLFAVLVSTALVSCGSGESGEPTKEEIKTTQDALMEMMKHDTIWNQKMDQVEKNFDSTGDYEQSVIESDKVQEWSDNWFIYFNEKYPDYDPMILFDD